MLTVRYWDVIIHALIQDKDHDRSDKNNMNNMSRVLKKLGTIPNHFVWIVLRFIWNKKPNSYIYFCFDVKKWKQKLITKYLGILWYLYMPTILIFFFGIIYIYIFRQLNRMYCSHITWFSRRLNFQKKIIIIIIYMSIYEI